MFELENDEKCYRVIADCSCKMVMEIWAKNKEETEELASNYEKYDFIDVEMVDTCVEDILKVEEIKE